MSSETELVQLIQVGHDLTSFRSYIVSVTALLVYDYLLTFKDEILYAWKTESTLVLVLFLFTRYLPLAFHAWVIISFSDPGYTSEMCDKTAFMQVTYYMFISALAQIFLTQRTYAITRKNKWVAGTLYTISLLQFGVGVYMSAWAILKPSIRLPQIPVDSYRICLAEIEQVFTVIQISLCLTFDILVFALVVVQTRILKSTYRGMSGSRILDTVTRDAEIYFIVITTSHLLIVVMFIVARSGIRSIPIVGTAAFIPMMICRMIMSLKKVVTSQPAYVSMELPIGQPTDIQDTYPPPAADNIQLSVFR